MINPLKNSRLLVTISVLLTATAHGANIRVIDAGVAGDNSVIMARNNLIAQGNTVTAGGTLSDYSAFDQVWDLRYTGNLTAADVTAMGSYLASGGAMYLSGENSGYNLSRNNSLVSWISSIGGGTVTAANVEIHGSQLITAAGQIVNSPTPFTSLSFSGANAVGAAATGNGFQVTAAGTLLGWDFGDIAGASGARMLVGFDIELFRNNSAEWTRNMVTYLGASAPAPAVPDSAATVMMIGLALCSIAAVRRSRKSW